MELKLRDLTDNDLDRICEIEEASFSMPWKREDFKSLIDDNNSTYLVLESEGVIIGAAGYTDNGFEGYINNVVIDKEFRGQGLSKFLMQGLIDTGKKRGVRDFTLEVRVNNKPAISLYEGLGFENAGVRKNFYERPVEDAYVMWLHT